MDTLSKARTRPSCRGACAAALTLFGLPAIAPGALADDIKARGVNPADNDTRADIIVKYNRLANNSGIFTTTLKFDYRLTQEAGLNIEFPVLGYFHSRPPAPGIPGRDDTGVGDVFLRLRYIAGVGTSRFGHSSIGAAVETVLPLASERTLGSGAVQLNASVLAVQAWSPTLITAAIAKTTHSIDEERGRSAIAEHSLRVVQAFVLPRGMFVTLDAKYNWETINHRDVWWEGVVEFGMMLDARTAASVGIGRKWGDRDDRGAISAAVKRFF